MPSDSLPTQTSLFRHPAIKIVGIIIAVSIGFFASDITKLATQQPEKTLDEYCMLSTATCIQDQVSITLNRDTAQPLLPVTLRIQWPNHEASQLILSLNALEMEMGTVKYSLKKSADGSFEGDIILPVCTLDNMTWVGELTDGTTTVYPALRMER